MDAYAKISAWAASGSRQYTSRALEKFLATDYAYSWLTSIGLMDNKYIIVTEEVSAPDIKREIKTPEVCDAFGLRYLNTIGLLRELGVRI
nr:DUF4411 family protein [Maribacter sp. 4U21]